MTKETNKEEKIAKLNGKYILYAAIIAGVFSLLTYFLNRNNDDKNSLQKQNSTQQNTIKPDTLNKSTNISNNTINQQNSPKSNAQIGTNNSK